MAKIDIVDALAMRRAWDVVKRVMVACWEVIEPMIASSFLTIRMIWDEIEKGAKENEGSID